MSTAEIKVRELLCTLAPQDILDAVNSITSGDPDSEDYVSSLENGFRLCPECGDDTPGTGAGSDDGVFLVRECFCYRCGTRWQERYECTGIMCVTPGKKGSNDGDAS